MAIYADGAPEEKTRQFFKISQANWDAVANFVTAVLPNYLPDHGFVGDEFPGEADFHLGGYLARIVSTLGGSNEQDGWKSLSAFGEVPASVSRYWKTWQARESWAVVYKDGLH